jgi:hypothetical protein
MATEDHKAEEKANSKVGSATNNADTSQKQ